MLSSLDPYLGTKCLHLGHQQTTKFAAKIKKFSVLYDFLVIVKAVPHKCVIRTGQP